MYKKPTKKPIYHVFTNERDDWIPESEAYELFKTWAKEFGNARLYSTQWNKIEGTWDDVDCLESIGLFPI